MVLWDSSNGPAIRVINARGEVTYAPKPEIKIKKHKLTEAEDNAIGRKIRRRQNKAMKGWRPYAKR